MLLLFLTILKFHFHRRHYICWPIFPATANICDYYLYSPPNRSIPATTEPVFVLIFSTFERHCRRRRLDNGLLPRSLVRRLNTEREGQTQKSVNLIAPSKWDRMAILGDLYCPENHIEPQSLVQPLVLIHRDDVSAYDLNGITLPCLVARGSKSNQQSSCSLLLAFISAITIKRARKINLMSISLIRP